MNKEDIKIRLKPIAIGVATVSLLSLAFLASINLDFLNGFYFSFFMFIGGLVANVSGIENKVKTSVLNGIVIYVISLITSLSFYILFRSYSIRILLDVLDPFTLFLFCLPAVIGSITGYYIRKLLKK